MADIEKVELFDSSESAKILLVDDQEPFLKLFCRFFQKTDYSITTISDPDAAIKLVESGEDFDLVVLDVMMPFISGYDICKIIRKKKNLFEMPVLFLTARRESEAIVQGFAVGGNDYVTKPFESTELIARTQTLVRLKKLYEANRILSTELLERNSFLQRNIHDLKNPLTSIMVLASMVQRDLIEDKENFKNLDVIIHSSEMMTNLVNEILEVNTLKNKAVNLEFEVFDFNNIFEKIIDQNKPLAERKGQSILISKDLQNSKVMIDGEKMIRAIDNIIGNAIKFSPTSKPIYTSLSNIEANSNKYIRLEIKDEGPGFTQEEKSNIFSKGIKYHAQATGGESSSGLGLLIAKELIELNNGRIWLDNNYNNGSKFIIELPIASA